MGSATTNLNSLIMKGRPEMTKHIAIIGGGYLGFRLAKAMENKANVTLIEPRSHFVHSIAMARAVVEPSIFEDSLIPYDKLLKKGTWVQARAASVDDCGVTLEDGRRVDADYIVVATGSDNATPFKAKGADIEGFRAAHDATHAKLKAAKSVAIVGAGAVGTELAGEIAHFMPEKQVTLVTDEQSLFPMKPAKMGQMLGQQLQSAGVKLLTGQRVENLKSLTEPYAGTLKLANGDEIAADLIFPTIGSRAISDLLQGLPGFAASSLGRAKVDQYLRPSEYANVFAAGDVADAGEGMTVVATYSLVPWLTKTLTALIDGKSIETLKPYKPAADAPLLIPLGPKNGNTYLGKMVLGGFMTSLMKGKSLFITRNRKQFGLG